MRLTPELEQTRELHTLYKKCHIAAIWPASQRYAVGKCQTCGNTYVWKVFPGLGYKRLSWKPIPRDRAARYIRQERRVRRERIKRLAATEADIRQILGPLGNDILPPGLRYF
jgi:hypothetical protein